MKYNILLTSALIGLIAIFSFSTIDSSNEKTLNSTVRNGMNCNPITSSIPLFTNPLTVLDEVNFYVHGFYGVYGNDDRFITKSDLAKATTLEDLMSNYPSNWIHQYESVWVKTTFGDKKVSLMSKDEKLSDEQRSLLNESSIGSFYDIVINFERKDDITGEITHERINMNLTVVPEIQADFPLGYEKLIAYFQDNSRERLGGIEVDDFTSLYVSFIIGPDGKAKDITVNRTCNHPEIDELILKLIREMPVWTSAKDANRNPVNQRFELVYGWPGC
ncbi:MAG: hypothetical protein RIE58_00780 [Vicingaceae bacterium]